MSLTAVNMRRYGDVDVSPISTRPVSSLCSRFTLSTSSDIPAAARAIPGQICGTRPNGCSGPSQGSSRLDDFNVAPPGIAEAVLLSCCGSRRWAARLAEYRPYPDLSSLLAAADEASYDLTPADLIEALAEEPGADQPVPGSHGPGTLAAHTALRAAHAAYEARFGHVFVVSLDGHHPAELLDQLLASIRVRLGNDPDEERVVTAEELRRISRARLVRLARGRSGDPAAPAPRC